MLRARRLVLRQWRESDLAPCAAMTQDPEVMRFFGVTRDRPQSDAWVGRVRAHFAREGFGIWAIEAPGIADFIGFVGLSRVPGWMPVAAGGIEAVWTLDRPFWRQGYATEAAEAAMADGFGRLGLREIVAFTAAVNLPSRGVMEGLGMLRDPSADFMHPRVPPDSPLCPHVLYRSVAPAGAVSALPQHARKRAAEAGGDGAGQDGAQAEGHHFGPALRHHGAEPSDQDA